jgi:two-component system sensor histidine kinase UhpB
VAPAVPLFWRVFAVNAGLLVLIAVLLLVTPVEISAPIARTQALIVVGGLVIAVLANALLLRAAVAPLERLAQRMDMVDLLRPGRRLEAGRDDEVGRVIRAFNQMVDRLEDERQQRGRRILAAQESERVGIARDLHDEVGQVLTSVLLRLDLIARTSREHRDGLDDAKESVRRALNEVRRISSELRPETLEQLGLDSALIELTATFARVTGIGVERELHASLPKLSAETELAVYRIAQESLTNVARHANASHVTVTLEHGLGKVVLRVADNGRGFEHSTSRQHGGLRSMRERALLIGAALSIEEAPGGGVEVRLVVPLARDEAPEGAGERDNGVVPGSVWEGRSRRDADVLDHPSHPR